MRHPMSAAASIRDRVEAIRASFEAGYADGAAAFESGSMRRLVSSGDTNSRQVGPKLL